MKTQLLSILIAGVLPATAGTLTVTNLNDSGSGSLRQTIADALPDDTITFSGNVTGAIALTSGELIVATNLNIVGPGAAVLAVSGNNLSRVFRVTGGSVAFSGLTIRNGLAAGAAGGGPGVSGGSESGGGILNQATLSLTDCDISGNVAQGGNGGGGGGGGHGGMAEGGGIASTSALSLTNCTVSGNQARGGDGGSSGGGSAGAGGDGIGGGIYTEGSLLMHQCVSDNNSAIGGHRGSGGGGSPEGLARGGGIKAAGTMDLTLCTIYGNLATSPDNGRGGGIESGTSTTIRSCTIASNNGQNSGGGIERLGTLTIQNTIVALNNAASGRDVFGAVVSQGHNLLGVQENTSGWGGPNDQLGGAGSPLDPLLGSLQDNGGPTPTLALRWGSPAMDQGNSTGLATDQRGEPRYDDPTLANATGGDGTDIGAYEAAGLRIVDWGKLGNDFKLSHTSLVNRGYNVLSRSNSATGIWTTNLNNVPGNGGVNQVTLTNVATGPQLYFRVQRLP